MANQNYRIFPNKVELFKFFGSYIPELNVGISSRLPLNGFCLGTEHKAYRTTIEFFSALAELSGLDVDSSASTLRMGNYIVFFNSALPNPHRRGKVVQAVVETKAVEAVVVEDKGPSVEEILSEAQSLSGEEDKKGSKDKLAEFASKNGVTLTKTKTFENMMLDFKAALEA